ncbi:glycosyltransferase family 4 protein, partial [Neobacillus drentensis]|uniref:glycosyltransferase family 4 protein n=1 Tax=Neobacillus drentensis TaxID=220684 RepID=UPI002FFE275A
KNHTKYRNHKLYKLCASAYTSFDMKLFKSYPNKMYKWGYFPEVREYDLKKLMRSKSDDIIELLWVGRFLKWKHPDKAINLAKRLKQDRLRFKLRLIGTGELEKNLKLLIIENNLQDCVEIIGPMSPDKVRENMEKANIYLFTSNTQEGWGAVLNEAMNSACAVVASHTIGSVPYLLQHEHNGLIYNNNDFEDLYSQVKRLFADNKFRKSISVNAYNTMTENWNAKKAAERLLLLSENILMGKNESFLTGICSKAEIITSDRVLKDKLSEGNI